MTDQTFVEIRLIGSPADVETVSAALEVLLAASRTGRQKRPSRYDRAKVISDLIVPIQRDQESIHDIDTTK